MLLRKSFIRYINLKYSKKNFFQFNFNQKTNIFREKNTSLIIHPEFSSNTNNSPTENYDKIIFNQENENNKTHNYILDDNLDFIKLDSNGIPIIKNNYYELLGLDSNCTPKQIRFNYLKIAKKYHPDKVAGALSFFSQVCVAYETLINTEKRANYDEELLSNTESIYYMLEFYKEHMMNYNCPLGVEKFTVDNLKYNENNLKMIEFIESTKEDIIKENTRKIAEDDEYEYYVEEEN